LGSPASLIVLPMAPRAVWTLPVWTWFPQPYWPSCTLEQKFEGPQVVVIPPGFEGTGGYALEGIQSNAASNGHI